MMPIIPDETYPLLTELECPLILCDSQQFLYPPLIWGKTCDLSHKVPHKPVLFGYGLKNLTFKLQLIFFNKN